MRAAPTALADARRQAPARRQAAALAALAALAPPELVNLGAILPLATAQPLADGMLAHWPAEPIARCRRLHLTKSAERRRRLTTRDDLYRELAGLLWRGEPGRELARATAAKVAHYFSDAWKRERGRAMPADPLRAVLHRLAGAIEATGEGPPGVTRLRSILAGLNGSPIDAAHEPRAMPHRADDPGREA